MPERCTLASTRVQRSVVTLICRVDVPDAGELLPGNAAIHADRPLRRTVPGVLRATSKRQLRRVRSLRYLGAVVVGALLLEWAAVSVASALSAPATPIVSDNAADIASAFALTQGQWPTHGPESWNPGSLHPGPLLYFILAAGIASGGASPVNFAAVAVLLFYFSLYFASAIVLSLRAGLAMGLVLVASALTLHSGLIAVADPPALGRVWTPAVAAAVIVCLSLIWGLAFSGGWALPLAALSALAAAQLYLLVAPVAGVVLASLLVVMWRLRNRRSQRVPVAVTLGVFAVGALWLIARLVVEGPAQVWGSVFGSGPALGSYVSEGWDLLAQATRLGGFFVLLPLVGVPLAVLISRLPSRYLLRPAAWVSASSGVLAVLLASTLVVSMNRADPNTSTTWPAQAALIAHAFSLVALVLLLLLSSALVKLRRAWKGGGYSLGPPLVAHAGVSMGVALAIAGIVVLNRYQLPLPAPWFPASEASAALARTATSGLPQQEEALVAVLRSEETLDRGPDPVVGEAVAATLVWGLLDGAVCFKKPAFWQMQLDVSCGESTTTVVTFVDPSWGDRELPPGTVTLTREAPSGTVRVLVSNASHIRAWLHAGGSGTSENLARQYAYCDLDGCPSWATRLNKPPED